jgi:parallel beta-helix repeat protein
MCCLGIHIQGSKKCKIINNNIFFSSLSSNGSGICLNHSSENLIEENHIKYDGPGDQNIAGFSLYNSNENKILNNHVILLPEKFVFVLDESCDNSLSYYANEGHIFEDGVECNETWNKCNSGSCKSCSNSAFGSCNHWWYL